MASPSSSGKSPRFNPTSELVSKIMRPALTSHYAIYLNPAVIQNQTSGNRGSIRARTFFESRQSLIDEELLTLSCSEASLPGSSLATHEINNDFTGVTERHAYRRQYDDRIDFTFYVDTDHKVIKFFETWMSWIVSEDQFADQSKLNYSYRVKFPTEYRCDIFVQKFEKDYTNYSEYTFIGAYPISITSMPVSYDSSQLLKCTVSFSYIRYFMNNSVSLVSTSTPSPIPSVPEFQGPGLPGDQANELWRGLREDYINRLQNDPALSLDFLNSLPRDNLGRINE
jgi:hypothetical protein